MKSDFPKTPPEFILANDMYFQGLSDPVSRKIMTKTLSNWSNQVSLTEVIKEINAFMYNNPPQYKQGQQPGDIYRPNQMMPGAGPIAQNHHEEEKKQPEIQIEMDVVELNKPQLDVVNSRLDSLNIEQLRELKNNPEKLEEFYLEDDGVKEIQVKLNSYKQHIHSIGEANLDKKNEIKAMNESLDSTFEKYQSLKDQSQSLRNRMFEQSEGMNSQKIKSILMNKALHADKDSEYAKKSLLNGDLDVKKFVREYTEVRKLYHNFAVLGNKIPAQ